MVSTSSVPASRAGCAAGSRLNCEDSGRPSLVRLRRGRFGCVLHGNVALVGVYRRPGAGRTRPRSTHNGLDGACHVHGKRLRPAPEACLHVNQSDRLPSSRRRGAAGDPSTKDWLRIAHCGPRGRNPGPFRARLAPVGRQHPGAHGPPRARGTEFLTHAGYWGGCCTHHIFRRRAAERTPHHGIHVDRLRWRSEDRQQRVAASGPTSRRCGAGPR